MLQNFFQKDPTLTVLLMQRWLIMLVGRTQTLEKCSLRRARVPNREVTIQKHQLWSFPNTRQQVKPVTKPVPTPPTAPTVDCFFCCLRLC